ncbi:MAG: putative acyltransferase [Ilumatobacteraceae bacterium]|nr:putative acyltransferase [Ilumatobacteraceae bacterium]
MAVLAVVLFHAGVARAEGGFLGVSLFFTLSGFLITRLLLAEHARDGRISLGAFWGRRVRRLAPAALLCLALVLVGSHWLVSAVGMRSLRGDIVAAAANVANWRFLTAGQSYASLFVGRPSPVLHFWSLAIEEQFYFVFPCIVALLLVVRRRWALPFGLGVLAAGSLAATLAATDHDLVYYSTHTRAGELLVGALLAWWVSRREAGASAPPDPRAAWRSLVPFVSLLGFVVLVVTTPQSAGWLYRGGLMAVALLWCPMIVAASASGPFAALLGRRVLAALGRRSYGIYVFHWPVFVLLTPTVLHLDGWVARLVQLAVIASLTEVSYRVVERPVRERRVLSGGVSMRVAAMGTIAAVVVAALVVPATPTSAHRRISMLDAPDAPVLLSGSQPTARALSLSSSAAGTTPRSTSTVATVVPAPPFTPAPPSSSTVAKPPPLRVTVVGSDLGVVRALAGAADGAGTVRIVDDVLPNCPVVQVDDAWPTDPSCPVVAPAAPRSDVLVVALGSADHAAFADRVAAAAKVFSVSQQYAISEHLDRLGVAAFEHLSAAAGRVIVVDAAPSPGDLLSDVLTEAAVSSTNLSVHAVGDLDQAFVADLATPAAPPALRVMVIGDSTSYGVATGLAGSAEHLDVLWAGKRNCPLVTADATVLLGNETSASACPDVHHGWPEALATFRPDVVVAVDSLPEEGRQRYPGDTDWSDTGSPRYIQQHDAGMRDLLGLIASSGAVVEVADAPTNPTDGQSGWTSNDDIARWNAQVHRWDDQWAPVQTVGYAGLVEAAEAAAGHSLRPDGAHLDDASVTSIIGGSLAPLLVQQVDQLRRALAASGCLLVDATGPHLDLPACSG